MIVTKMIVTKKTMNTACRTALLLGAVLSLAACSMETPTRLAGKRVELASGPAYKTMAVAQWDEAALRDFAREYARYGDGPVELTVSYDPRARQNTALSATENAARIARSLRQMGVTDVQTAIMPVNMLGEGQQAGIRYHAVTASAPEGCVTMGGVDNRDITPDDYGYGCTVESLLARQIARPADLAGRAGLGAGDGRRAATNAERYRTNANNPALRNISIGN